MSTLDAVQELADRYFERKHAKVSQRDRGFAILVLWRTKGFGFFGSLAEEPNSQEAMLSRLEQLIKHNITKFDYSREAAASLTE